MLDGRGDALEGELTIADDGSYRVALADADGLSNPGETEYFIRTLEDRPPDVRIIRPASDRKVTPIEEVPIEARAEDDFGVASLELVYAVRGGQEKAVPFERTGSGLTVAGRRIVYLEDLGVEPGDFVDLLRAGPRRQPRQAVDGGAQRHLLPRGHAVRGGVRRLAEPGRRPAARTSGRSRRWCSAEGHHHGDLEARPAWP